MRHRLLSILLPVAWPCYPTMPARSIAKVRRVRISGRSAATLALKAADEKRLALYERVFAGLPAAEQPAFAAYESGWVGARNGRCPVRDGEVDKTCLREAIDDHAAELAMLDGKSSGSAATPAIPIAQEDGRQSKRRHPCDLCRVRAAADAGGALFNEQVLKLVDRLPFSQSIDPKTTSTWQDTIDVRTIYRSPRLIAVKFAEWVCCGAYGLGRLLRAEPRCGERRAAGPREMVPSRRGRGAPAGTSSSTGTRAASRFAASTRCGRRSSASARTCGGRRSGPSPSRRRAAILGPDGLRQQAPTPAAWGIPSFAKSTVAGFQLPLLIPSSLRERGEVSSVLR